MQNGTLSALRQSWTGRGAHFLAFGTFLITACGGNPRESDSPDTVNPSVDERLTVLSPGSGAEYVGAAPPVIIVADPPLTEAELPQVTASLGGIDISGRLAIAGTTLVATGLSSVLSNGANQLALSLGDEAHQINFTYQPCAAAPCEPVAPQITGPAKVIALQQEQLTGIGLGGPGDHRVLHVGGHAIELPGGHYGDTWLMFIAPMGFEQLEVLVEVNGVKSNPWTVEVEPPPALERPAVEVVADFVDGLNALEGLVQALPALDSGDAELDDKVVEVRTELNAAIGAALPTLTQSLKDLPPEATEQLAHFLELSSLDTLFTAWAEPADAGKADSAGLPFTIDGQCERTILRSYKLVSYLTLIQDWIKAFTFAMVFLAILSPIAIASIPVLAGLMAQVTFVLGLVKLFIVSSLPDVTGIKLDLPELVPRDEEVQLHAKVQFTYDPLVKQLHIANWAAESFLGTALGAAASRAGFPDFVVEVTSASLEKTLELAKYLEKQSAGGVKPDGIWVDADPTLIGFESSWFRLRAHDDLATCAAIGSWANNAPCVVKDLWQTGRNMSPAGPSDMIWSKTLSSGVVSSSADSGGGEYLDEAYGVWLLEFGRKNGCEMIAECWEVFQASSCNPGLSNILCNVMSLGYCPDEADILLATQHCMVCPGE